MATVVFTQHLKGLAPPAPIEVSAGDLKGALDEVFAALPRLRGYVLDEQRRLRRHVNIFVDGRRVTDRDSLAVAIGPGSEIYVMQALSGG